MSPFGWELSVFSWLGQTSQHPMQLNQFISYVVAAPLFKGLPFMTLIWFYWFRDGGKPKAECRPVIITVLCGTFLGLFITRVANHFGPVQLRPVANKELFPAPLEGMTEFRASLTDWNSFPSDHGALFFALSFGIFLISRWAGILAFIYTVFVIALPRVYLGLHYPMDLIAGGAIGIACVLLATSTFVRRLYLNHAVKLLYRYPAAFQAALFVFSFELALMFGDVRRALNEFAGLLR